MRLLVITYYWPPSGGPGVQRWLKTSIELLKKGIDVEVLTCLLYTSPSPRD